MRKRLVLGVLVAALVALIPAPAEAFTGIRGRLKLRGTVDLTDSSFTERVFGRLGFALR